MIFLTYLQNHIGDKIETMEFLTALALAICEFSFSKFLDISQLISYRIIMSSYSLDSANSELDVEKLKRHCKILGCYVKDSLRSQNTCIQAVESFVKDNSNAQGNTYLWILRKYTFIFETNALFLFVDLRAKIMSALCEENVIPESLVKVDTVSHDMDKLCLDDRINNVDTALVEEGVLS